MKVVLYAAVSVDGFIADRSGGTDWVKDDEVFEKVCKEAGCIVMGNNTFKEYGEPPFKNVQHLVLSTKDQTSEYKNVHFVSSPNAAIQKTQELGFEKLLVIGGGQCNSSFAQNNLLNEVWLDEHPLRLGKGVGLFGGREVELDLSLYSKKQYRNFVHKKSKVIKNWREL